MKDVALIRVVVASPSDVQSERETLSRVADELNRTIGRAYDLRVEVNRWETDAHPGFHVEGPQGLIDPILRIEECDVFVGIFWKRFGTPVKATTSGTQHEFTKAYRCWKKQGSPHIMFYFSKQPHTPSNSEESAQWNEVKAFQQNFPAEGLWWSYGEPLEFERQVRNHLTMYVLDRVKEVHDAEVIDETEHDEDDEPIYDETLSLERNLHVPFLCELEESDQINIDVTSDMPIDIMIFDKGDYRTWMRTGSVDTYYGHYEEREHIHAFFTAPGEGTYLVVVSNSSTAAADLQVTISYVRE
jgi:hypothetical protein